MKKFLLLLLLLAAGCNPVAINNPDQSTPVVAVPTSTPTKIIQNYTNNSTESQEKTFRYQGVEGKTALELLKAQAQVETKTYDSLGEFVVSINGLKGDDQHYWAFYVNNQQASVGASSYLTKDGEVIEWKYENMSSFENK